MSLRCKCGRGLVNATGRVISIVCSDCGTEHEVPPSGNVQHSTDYPEQQVDQHETMDQQREHWRKLHAFPFSDDWGCASRCKWWTDWQAAIPNIGCDCRKHWRDLVAATPPDFSSPAAFFRWTVEAHNAVNKRLGKPIMSLEDAWQLYS